MIPEGYNEMAQSTLPGTGGVIATAYQKLFYGETWVFFKIEDPAAEENEINEYELGPIPIRLIKTLNHVVGDVMFLKGIRT